MALEMTCTKCGKKIELGKWECFPGEKHAVEQRIYRVANSCDSVTDRAKSHLKVYVTPDREFKDENGVKTMIPARKVEFVGGVYETCDPEDIFFFETKYQKHLIDQATWEKMYIHPKELLAMKERSLESRSKRLESEENALLSRIKKLQEEADALEKKGKKAGA